MTWFGRFRRRAALDRDLDRELQDHLERRTQALIAAGLTPAQARRQAIDRERRRRAGEGSRARRPRHALGARLRAGRPLRRRAACARARACSSRRCCRWASASAPTPRSSRSSTPCCCGRCRCARRRSSWSSTNDSFTNPIWEEMRRLAPAFSSGALAWSEERLDLSNGGETDPASGLWVSGSFFETLGVQPALGRLIGPADDRRGGGPDGPTLVDQPRLLAAPLRRRSRGHRADAGDRAACPSRSSASCRRASSAPSVGRSFDVAIPIGTVDLVKPGGPQSQLDGRSTWWLSVMFRLRPDQSIDAATAALRGVQPQIREATLPTDWPAEMLARYLNEPLELTPAATGMSEAAAALPRAAAGADGDRRRWCCSSPAPTSPTCCWPAPRRGSTSCRRGWPSAPRMDGWSGSCSTESLAARPAGRARRSRRSRCGARASWSPSSRRRSRRSRSRCRSTGGCSASSPASPSRPRSASAWRPAWRTRRVDASDAVGHATPQPRDPARSGVRAAGGRPGGAVAGARRRGRRSSAGRSRRWRRAISASTRMICTPSGSSCDARRRRRGPSWRRGCGEAAARRPGRTAAAVSVVEPMSGMGWNGPITVPGGPDRSGRDRMSMFNAITPGWFATYGTRIVAGRDFDRRDDRRRRRWRSSTRRSPATSSARRPRSAGASADGNRPRRDRPSSRSSGSATAAAYRGVRSDVPADAVSARGADDRPAAAVPQPRPCGRRPARRVRAAAA